MQNNCILMKKPLKEVKEETLQRFRNLEINSVCRNFTVIKTVALEFSTCGNIQN